MISDKQFDDAFTSVGGWFFLRRFELISAWAGSKAELVNLLYSEGFDVKSARETQEFQVL